MLTSRLEEGFRAVVRPMTANPLRPTFETLLAMTQISRLPCENPKQGLMKARACLGANSKFYAMVTKGMGRVLSLYDHGLSAAEKDEGTEEMEMADEHVALDGHSDKLVDFDFNPFDPNVVATCSKDGTAKIWQVPELTADIPAELLGTLRIPRDGNDDNVLALKYHPLANQILTTMSKHSISIWDLRSEMVAVEVRQKFSEPCSFSFNELGNQVLTTTPGSGCRIFDLRSSQMTSEWEPHQFKQQTAVWATRQNLILTSGYSRFLKREESVWDPRHLAGPLNTRLGQGMISKPFATVHLYDPDTELIYYTTKGSKYVTVGELSRQSGGLEEIREFGADSGIRGICMLPKLSCDIGNNEIAQINVSTKTTIEKTSITVPKEAEGFDEAVYPDSVAPRPAANAQEWLSGADTPPPLVSLRPLAK